MASQTKNTKPRRNVTFRDRKSTRLNSSHTEIYTLSLHDALPIWRARPRPESQDQALVRRPVDGKPNQEYQAASQCDLQRSEEHTSELQSHRDLHSFPTRRSSDLESTSTSRISRPSAGEEARRWQAKPRIPSPVAM